MTRPSVHRNLVDSSRQLFELDPGARVDAADGWLLGAGRSDHPVVSNAVFRREDGVDAAELLVRAREFFFSMGRGFSVWTRGGQAEDRDLIAAAEAAGMQLAYGMPEMVLESPAEEPALGAGVELRRLTSADQAEDYWRIAAASYAEYGFPPEIFSGYTDHAGLLAENVVAFLAYVEDEPVSIAMTVVSDGVAGIYWVGTLERARGRGLGRATTAAATNAGFELGAEIASLQASPMGKPIYEAMGFETIYEYRMLTAGPT